MEYTILFLHPNHHISSRHNKNVVHVVGYLFTFMCHFLSWLNNFPSFLSLSKPLSSFLVSIKSTRLTFLVRSRSNLSCCFPSVSISFSEFPGHLFSFLFFKLLNPSKAGMPIVHRGLQGGKMNEKTENREDWEQVKR